MFTPADFDYQLDPKYIAQIPADPRDSSKLLRLNRADQSLADHHFYDLPQFLTSNDVLVLNQTKVFPARLLGHKDSGGQVEILLLKPMGNDIWEALSGSLKTAKFVRFGSELVGHIIKKEKGTGNVLIQLETANDQPIESVIDKLGKIPIPPYIHSPLTQKQLRNSYQTVYAKTTGSAAAPTAGLHFTDSIFNQLKQRNVQIETVTLHVGLGTFSKLKQSQIESKSLHPEWYSIAEDTADRLNQAKANGKRIIAVGTTTTRTLESAWKNNAIQSGSNSTDLFIMPPHKFNVADALITNFHLPQSSLLMLVSAFMSQPNSPHPFTTFDSSFTHRAYQHAINNNYRFFSFGDAMFIE